MNKFKSIIAMLIASILIVSIAGVGVLAEAESIDEQQNNIYEKMMALGILDEDDNVDPKAPVTRKELAKLAMCLINRPEMGGGDVNGLYHDISSANSYAPYILCANQLGVMKGYGDGNFHPDDEVTRNQVAKVFTILLGYGNIIRNDAEYIERATRLGVFKKCTNTDVITWKDILQIADNALGIELLESIAHSNSSIKYANQDNTLLSRYFGISILTGILEANPYTHLMSAANGCADNQIIISGTTLFTNGSTAEEYIGYKVKAYYKKENKELLYVDTEFNNTVTKVGHKDILNDKTTRTTFAYKVGEKTRTIDIDPVVIFLYNGKQCSLTIEKLCPSVGEVILIDNDKNGRVDVIHVTEYNVLVADSINTRTGEIIGLSNNGSVVLDELDDDYSIKIIKNGEPASFSSIKRYDTVLYAASTGSGKNIIKVLVANNTIEGKVTSISGDEVEIEGAFYELSEFINIKLGETGLYFVDAFDRVVGKKIENDIVYGYLHIMEKATLGKVQLRIFTENDRWVTLSLKKNFKYNTVKGYSANKFYSELKDTEYQQLITYRVNPDYEVYELNTAQTVTAWSPEEDAAINNNIFRLSRNYGSIRYRSLPAILGGYELPLTDNTKLFMIPASKEEEDYHVGSLSELKADQEYKNVFAYDCDEYGVPKACVINNYDAPLDEASEVMVVKDVIRARNANDDFSYGIVGYHKNVEITVTTADDSVVDSLEGIHFGSVIQILMNSQGDVSKINVLYNYTPSDQTLSKAESLYSQNTFIKAKVFRVDKDGGRVILTLKDDSKAVMDVKKLLKAVYVCDEADEDISVGSIEDVCQGKKIFAHFKYGRADSIVVYE